MPKSAASMWTSSRPPDPPDFFKRQPAPVIPGLDCFANLVDPVLIHAIGYDLTAAQQSLAEAAKTWARKTGSFTTKSPRPRRRQKESGSPCAAGAALMLCVSLWPWCLCVEFVKVSSAPPDVAAASPWRCRPLGFRRRKFNDLRFMSNDTPGETPQSCGGAGHSKYGLYGESSGWVCRKKVAMRTVTGWFRAKRPWLK